MIWSTSRAKEEHTTNKIECPYDLIKGLVGMSPEIYGIVLYIPKHSTQSLEGRAATPRTEAKFS